MSEIWTFLKALPALFQLVKVLKARLKEAGIERKVSDDVKTIHEAFSAGDSTQLDTLFNS